VAPFHGLSENEDLTALYPAAWVAVFPLGVWARVHGSLLKASASRTLPLVPLVVEPAPLAAALTHPPVTALCSLPPSSSYSD
jgi:hypothetical protein